jgi:tetraacyldisaccharide 4'-kinase
MTAGGTGKTPLVIWLCNFLASQGVSSAVLSRGYKGSGGDADEPALIRRSCPAARVVINPDRYKGALEAFKDMPKGVFILDDGFQHRRIRRNLDIITIDATCPFGYDRVLPAGLLREPPAEIKRAKAAVITRCDIVTEEQINFIRWRLIRYNPNIVIVRAGHKYNGITMLDGAELEMKAIVGKKCFVFCGIGNPNAFLECLWNNNVSFTDYEIFEDHHNYTAADVNNILTKAADCDIILTTEKDFVKIQDMDNPQFRAKCGCTKFEIEFYDNRQQLANLINNAAGVK